MKVVNVAFFLFFLIPLYTMEDEADFFRITPGFDQIEETDIFRAIPPGFDPNAIEITYSTFINGDLSVAGTISPAPGVGNSKQRSFFFPATTIANRMAASPDQKFTDTFGANNRPVPTWQMLPSASSQKFLTVFFGIPAGIDTTVNPTLDLFIAVSIQGQPAGRTVRFQVDLDYAPSGDIIGINAPATGFDETLFSSNLSITEPTGLNNLKIYKVSVTLTAAEIVPGALAGIYFSRVAPTAGTEYAMNVYLVGANFNFSLT